MEWKEILDKLYSKEIEYRRAFDPIAEGIIMRLYFEHDDFLSSCLNSLPAEIQNLSDESENEKEIRKRIIDSCSDEQLLKSLIVLISAYEKHKKIVDDESFFNQPTISSFYNIKDSYGLIKLTENFELDQTHTPIRIIDTKKRYTIFIDTNINIAKVLFELKKMNFVKELFVRGNDNLFFDYINKINVLEHEKGVGIPSKNKCDAHPNIAYYYDINDFDNQFWVKKTEEELIFEELYQKAFSKSNYYTTQMVHIRYKQSVGGAVINHIDHEYIYYTPEEYENRRKAIYMDVKGTARRRQKTFKVDDAVIPEQYQVPVNVFGRETTYDFIPFVLYTLFKNTMLLDEYFNEVNS